MSKVILIGFLLVTRCASAWWFTDVTPDRFWDKNYQVNILQTDAPTLDQGHHFWWGLSDGDIIDFLEEGRMNIYIEKFEDDGTKTFFKIMVNPTR